MERYEAAGAKRSSIYFDFFYVCNSFIFVSLKTFHEELKTSSFVFLSPAPLLSSDHVTTKMFVEMKIYILRL